MATIQFLKQLLKTYWRKKERRYLIREAFTFSGKKGVEIGGPSGIFNLKAGMPLYFFAKQVDGVNFSDSTIWEGTITKGYNYNYFENRKGYQYISEATNLSEIADDKYDFLLSSHCLEHVANPLKAVYEWKRVLKKGGKLILVLPEKTNTFDHRRPFTNFEHILQDFNDKVDESDETHFEEIIQLHDYSRDPGVNSAEAFKIRLKSNYINRCAHQHVFNFDVITKMLNYCGFTVKHQQSLPPYHLITVAKKVN